MNQVKIGKFIALKRKEKNLTQEQLAERLSVSNKTVSKWECGKCMPDYALIETLCFELDINVSELISGTESDSNTKRNDLSIIEIMSEIDTLKTKNLDLFSLLLIMDGIIMWLLQSANIFGIVLNIILTVLSYFAMFFGLGVLIWSATRRIKNKK